MSEDSKYVFVEGGPFDRKDPRSLYNVMPLEAQDTFHKIPPEMLVMEESELEKMVKPSTKLGQIRLAFWKEYDSAQSTITRMTFKGIMMYLNGMPSLFLLTSLRQPYHLAWILLPPASYENTLEEALMRGLKRVNEILSLPFEDANGNLDPKIIELVLKATAFIDLRIHGKPTERIEQSVRSLEMKITSKDVKQLGGTVKIQDLDTKIRQLEEQLHPERFDHVE